MKTFVPHVLVSDGKPRTITILDDEDDLSDFNDSSAVFVKDGGSFENNWTAENYNFDPMFPNEATLDLTVGTITLDQLEECVDDEDIDEKFGMITTGTLTITLQKKGTGIKSPIPGPVKVI
ncbi:MAG: hypothetical protein NVSMB9_25340 [Isosphaeraceae bacterium]